MLLAEQGAQVRIYQSAGSSFHLKAYLFSGLDWGRAFIGSSNISRQALQQGLEWNYRINYPGDDGYLEACRRFDELFEHPRCITLSDAWIDAYERRRIKPVQQIEPGSTEHEPPPVPSKVQQEALHALRATREQGYMRGLVVLATGLGKTWLAAFDVKQMGARRVLFVAHREEILNQAAATFTRIQPRRGSASIAASSATVRSTSCARRCKRSASSSTWSASGLNTSITSWSTNFTTPRRRPITACCSISYLHSCLA